MDLKEKRLKFENSIINRLNHKVRLVFHPMLWFVITLRNRLSGYKVICLNKANMKTNRPIIFCITHIGKIDIEISAQVLKKHFYLLSGDFENVHGNLDGFFLELHGIIYLDKFDKEDTKKAKEKAVEIINKNGNIMWFPEGTWNLSANLPVLPLPFGVIEVAKRTGALILPVALEQYDKNVYVNFGEIIDVTTYKVQFDNDFSFKLEVIEDLKERLATLKFQIWEKQNKTERKTFSTDYHQSYIEKQVSQWSGFTYELIQSKIFKPKDVTTHEMAFEHLENIKPNKNNAFLFDKRLI